MVVQRRECCQGLSHTTRSHCFWSVDQVRVASAQVPQENTVFRWSPCKGCVGGGGGNDPLSTFYPISHQWFLSMRMFGKHVSKDALCHRLVQVLKEYESVHCFRKKPRLFFQVQKAVEQLDANDKRGLFRQAAFDWRTILQQVMRGQASQASACCQSHQRSRAGHMVSDTE